MGLDKELANMRRRLNKIVPQIQPPALKMHVVGASDPVPAPSPWNMTIYIESKKQTLGI